MAFIFKSFRFYFDFGDFFKMKQPVNQEFNNLFNNKNRWYDDITKYLENLCAFRGIHF